MIEAMSIEGLLSDAEYAGYEKVIDDLYAAVEKDEQYRPNVHLNALKRVDRGGS